MISRPSGAVVVMYRSKLISSPKSACGLGLIVSGSRIIVNLCFLEEIVGGSPATQLTIAARLKAARSAKRMTLRLFPAAASGVTKGYLSKVERGQSNVETPPSSVSATRLELQVGSLFDETWSARWSCAGEYQVLVTQHAGRS